MLVEAPVLDRDGRLRRPRAHVNEADGLAVPLGGDRAEERAVRGVDERVLTDRDRLERREVALGGDRRRPAEAADREQDDEEREPADEPEDEPAAALADALATAPAAPHPDREVVVARSAGAAAANRRAHA